MMTIYAPQECKHCKKAIFCEPCISAYLKTAEIKACPTCKKPNKGYVAMNEAKFKDLNNIRILCDKETCPKRGTLMTYKRFV